LTSGAAGAASGNLLSSVAQGKDGKDVFLSTLKGVAYGFFGKLLGATALKGPLAPAPQVAPPQNRALDKD
jgi:hypothetical protein